jgi:hypothetical protein
MFLPVGKNRNVRWLAALAGVSISAFVSAAPSSNFDLSHWKLTLPVDVSGGTSGVATEISTAQLAAGFTNEFFYSAPDGGMVFWCPVIGATTSGATFPRSELREMLDPRDTSVNWTADGTHILRGQCKVTQQPDAGAIIIGQIHGYSYSQRLVKLQFNNGVVQAYIRNSPTMSGDTKFTYANVPLNGTINYEIKVVDGVASIAVNGVTNSFDFFASDSAWRTIDYYFKAGSYVQDNVGTLMEGGRVAFYQLSVTHGAAVTLPAITSQPISQTVAPGASVTLNVGASGATTYQWRTNGVAYAGKTNASLPITNFRALDEKRYDMVVSSAAGSITSSVATLYLNTPLRFTNQSMTSKRFSALLLGAANSSYVIQSSSNMTTWKSISTNSSPTGIISFTDTNATGLRYYRAK